VRSIDVDWVDLRITIRVLVQRRQAQVLKLLSNIVNRSVGGHVC
jgi:hypothetical protein